MDMDLESSTEDKNQRILSKFELKHVSKYIKIALGNL